MEIQRHLDSSDSLKSHLAKARDQKILKYPELERIHRDQTREGLCWNVPFPLFQIPGMTMEACPGIKGGKTNKQKSWNAEHIPWEKKNPGRNSLFLPSPGTGRAAGSWNCRIWVSKSRECWLRMQEGKVGMRQQSQWEMLGKAGIPIGVPGKMGILEPQE